MTFICLCSGRGWIVFASNATVEIYLTVHNTLLHVGYSSLLGIIAWIASHNMRHALRGKRGGVIGEGGLA